MKLLTSCVATVAAALSFSAAQAADIKVGLVTSLSGPASSIGIPYAKGMQAALAYKSEVAGRKIHLITLDDASDPATAARNARKLVEEEKVDVLMGSAGAPAAMAVFGVGKESKTPLIALTPVALEGNPDGAWAVSVAQPPVLMVKAVVDRMKKAGVKTVGYIGYSDAWGDIVYDALTKNADAAGIKVVTNERYARADTSVTGQILKIVAARPDAVLTGGSGTPGALPYLALAERGYKGGIYGTHALINPDFVRVAGTSANGLLAPTGPVIVAEQLPADNPTKKVSMDFRAAYQKTHNAPTTDAFSAYSFDAWVVFLDAAARVGHKAEPGTAAYRAALKEALTSGKEVVGTHAVYNFTANSRYGQDERARVIVTLDKGQWKLTQ